MSHSENSTKTTKNLGNPSDKENARTQAKPASKKKLSSGERGPLSTLPENRVLKHSSGTYEVVTVETVVNIKKRCWSSSSTTEKETKTFSKKTTVSQNEKIKEEDEENDDVFIIASESEENEEMEPTEKKDSEHLPKGPVRKNSLMKKLIEKRKRNDLPLLDKKFSDCPYIFPTADLEYFQENYYYFVELDKKWIVKKAELQEVDLSFRVIAVNWLVQVQRKLRFHANTTLIAVRTFDNVLVKLKIPPNKYILFATACLWIIGKNMESRTIVASKLSKICQGEFTKNQIISAEKEILCLMNFGIAISDPLAFLEFYIKEENLEENGGEIRTYGTFLIELLMYSWEFSTNHSGYLAAAIMYLLFLKHNKDASSFLKRRSNSSFTKVKLMSCATSVESALKVILKNYRSDNNKIFSKYSASEKSYVTELFTDATSH